MQVAAFRLRREPERRPSPVRPASSNQKLLEEHLLYPGSPPTRCRYISRHQHLRAFTLCNSHSSRNNRRLRHPSTSTIGCHQHRKQARGTIPLRPHQVNTKHRFSKARIPPSFSRVLPRLLQLAQEAEGTRIASGCSASHLGATVQLVPSVFADQFDIEPARSREDEER